MQSTCRRPWTSPCTIMGARYCSTTTEPTTETHSPSETSFPNRRGPSQLNQATPAKNIVFNSVKVQGPSASNIAGQLLLSHILT
jgi:hypothetical protein